MKVTVVGTGNVGTAIAADLSFKGYEVTLLKTTGCNNLNLHQLKISQSKEILISEEKEMKSAYIKNFTCDYEKAIKRADIVIITIQTTFHKKFLQKANQYFESNQVIIFIPGYLSTSLFLETIIIKSITVVEMESSPIDCRITEPGTVSVLFRNVRNPIGVFPRSQGSRILNILSSFGYNYILRESVIDSSLHNPNLIVHTVGALMSIPRIELTNGEYWMYREVFTPTVWNLVQDLDAEKKLVLEKLSYPAINYLDSCKFRNSINLSLDSFEIFNKYAMNSAPKGPINVKSRYIMEDVPNGLVLLEALGNYTQVDTPICSSLINLASSFMCTDLRENGRTLKWLGRDNIKFIQTENVGYKND